MARSAVKWAWRALPRYLDLRDRPIVLRAALTTHRPGKAEHRSQAPAQDWRYLSMAYTLAGYLGFFVGRWSGYLPTTLPARRTFSAWSPAPNCEIPFCHTVLSRLRASGVWPSGSGLARCWATSVSGLFVDAPAADAVYILLAGPAD